MRCPTLGYAEGEHTPVDEVLGAVARIVGAVNVPVTVDFERGYRLSPAELVERLAATGARIRRRPAGRLH